MKYIKKVAATIISALSGAIVDSTNIDDKTTNVYSANIIDKLLAGTVIYEAGVDSVGVLKDSIINYKRIRIYAMSSDYHYIVQELLIKPHYTTSTGLVTSFWAGSVSTDSKFYGKNARLNLKDRTFTVDRNYAVTISPGTGATMSASDNAFTVQKIIGYNYQ